MRIVSIAGARSSTGVVSAVKAVVATTFSSDMAIAIAIFAVTATVTRSTGCVSSWMKTSKVLDLAAAVSGSAGGGVVAADAAVAEVDGDGVAIVANAALLCRRSGPRRAGYSRPDASSLMTAAPIVSHVERHSFSLSSLRRWMSQPPAESGNVSGHDHTRWMPSAFASSLGIPKNCIGY